MSINLMVVLIRHAKCCDSEGRPYGPHNRRAELDELTRLGYLEYLTEIRCRGINLAGEFWAPTDKGREAIKALTEAVHWW
jgi:hypothetical protein